MSVNSSVLGSEFRNKSTSRTKAWVNRPVACDFCRSKKVKCNGEHPCTNCLDRQLQCVMSTRSRRKLKQAFIEKDDMAERLSRIETLFQTSLSKENGSVVGSALSPQTHDPSNEPSQRSLSSTATLAASSIPRAIEDGHRSESFGVETQGTEQPSTVLPSRMSTGTFALPGNPSSAANSFTPGSMENMQPRISSSLQFPSNFDQNSNMGSITSPSTHFEPQIRGPKDVLNDWSDPRSSRLTLDEKLNWEHHGPKSYLSICSDPGIEWVIEQTSASGFREVAATFMTDVSKRLKSGKRISQLRKPEPEPEMAWRYTKAYFDKSVDAALGIVHRLWFESRLKAHLNSTSSHDGDDPGWYALRNTVYAAGCRIEMSESQLISDANQVAWGWFENALSVHTEIVYFQTTMVGIQALTLMAYYSENIVSPCLEYMLCTNALRLAISKGLHRQPMPSLNLNEDERSQRSLLFRAAYCLEKHIVSQSGRPSIIDDEEINCTIPQTSVSGSSVNLFYCDTLIQLAQLSSLACKRVFSYQAVRNGSKALIDTVTSLDEQLQALKRSKEHIFCLDAPIDPQNLPLSLSLQQTMYLQYAYFNTVLDIHTILTIPWSQNILNWTRDPLLPRQIEVSSQIVAQTCRAAILATNHIQINASTPHPLTFFGPISALINLFIHVLKYADQPGIQSDLALLTVCTGHFARLEFSTNSEISFPFVAEITALARDTIRRAKFNPSRPTEGPSRNACDGSEAALETIQSSEISFRDVNSVNEFSAADLDTCMSDSFDVELEKWSLMFPLPHPYEDISGFYPV